MHQERVNVCEEVLFQKIFETYSAQIRNFLVYKGGGIEQSNDIVQETFIKLWENCDKVEPEKAKSYLYTLASNAFKNELKHLKVKLKFAQTQNHDSKNIETPEFVMEESEFKQKLEESIQEMVPTQREVFLMNRIDKKKYAEIAEELGISIKAVEKRMGKALKFLRSRVVELK